MRAELRSLRRGVGLIGEGGVFRGKEAVAEESGFFADFLPFTEPLLVVFLERGISVFPMNAEELLGAEFFGVLSGSALTRMILVLVRVMVIPYDLRQCCRARRRPYSLIRVVRGGG